MITGLQTGGAEMMLYKLLSGIDRSRFEPIVISLMDEGTLGARIKETGVRVISLNIGNVLTMPGGLRRLRRQLREIQPDLLLGWLPHGNLFATMAGAMTHSSIPVLWNVRQSLDTLRQEKAGTMAAIGVGAALARMPGAIIYNSRRGAEQHEAIGYPRDKSRFIANGFDCALFRPDPALRLQVRAELGLGESDLVIGNAGRYHAMKGHDTFFEAAGIIARNHPDARFVLAGRAVEWSNPVLSQLAHKFNIADKVLLLGERTDMHRICAALDVATLASSWGEGFPNVVGEAMACGVPCVVTDVGDAAWIVGDSGVVVRPRNAQAFAEACHSLINRDASERQRMGWRARKRVVQEFSLEAIVRQYEELFTEVHERARRNARVAVPIRTIDAPALITERRPDVPGALVISLDFELHWGVRDIMARGPGAERYFAGARRAVPAMLDLFSEFEMSATWATVGLLFARNNAEVHDVSPALRPRYHEPRLNPYDEPIGSDELSDPMHYAPSLIAQVRATPNQEIGTHTFSHYYCLDPGQNAEMFRQDLASAMLIARRNGIAISSIVFPRNQHNRTYDDILIEAGIRAYRANERGWMHSASNSGADMHLTRRMARVVDDYIGSPNSTRWTELQRGSLFAIPASCFLRPVAPWRMQLDRVRRAMVIKGMREAARSGRVFHIWWHPHNFSTHQALNLRLLRELLEEFARLRESHGMLSLNMAQATGIAAGVSKVRVTA